MASAKTPVIQVLSRQNYEDQHIVALPDALPLSPLGPSSIRVQSTILALTTNNFSYARIGHLVGWWNFHPLPPSVPAELSDPATYGRISAWGYGTVVESTADIPVGTQVYGYLPIGTLPVDMLLEFNPEVPGRFEEVSAHRIKLLAVYNRYFFDPKAATAQDKHGQGYDALFRVLFETSYMLNRFVFAWNASELVHPSGAGEGWSFEDAQIGGATVLVFSASGKTALAFAHQLKYGRPVDKKPRAVVAVGSKDSKGFTEGTELYDQVFEYAADDSDLGKKLGLSADSKVVVCDFGARENAAARWLEKLKEGYKNVSLVRIGGEVVADSPDKALKKYMGMVNSGVAMVNASGLRDAAMAILGQDAYFDGFYTAWNQCKAEEMIKGLRLVWGTGMEELGKGWEKLYKGEVGADEGLVFDLTNERSV